MVKKTVSIFSIILLNLSLAAGVTAEEISLISCEGTVQLLSVGRADWVLAEAGVKLSAGDSLRTWENSSVDIEIRGNVLRLKENSVIQIEGIEQVDLLDGKLLAAIKRLPPEGEFKIASPVAISGIRGTSFSMAIMPDNYTTELKVAEGEVRFISRSEADKFTKVGKLGCSVISPWEFAEIGAEGKGILSEKILGKEIKSSASREFFPITKEEYSSKFGALARITTERAARTDAHRKLAEIMYGAVIDSKTTLEDYAVKNDVIRSTVKGVVKGATVTGIAYYSDGQICIGMKIPAGEIVDRLKPITGDIFGFNYLASPGIVQIEDFESYLEIQRL